MDRAGTLQPRLGPPLCRRHKDMASITVVIQGCLRFTIMSTMSQLDIQAEEASATMIAARDAGRGVPRLGWLAEYGLAGPPTWPS